MKKKIIRVTTVPLSLTKLLSGQLNFMSDYYDILAVSSNGNNDLKKVEEREGVKTFPIEMTRKITPIKDLAAVWKLYKLFKKEKPFIVHSHTPKAGTLSMLAARFAGVPHRLHTIAGLPLIEATGIKRVILNLVEKITYKCATKIYPNAHGLVKIIIDNNFTKMSKLKVIANGSSNGIDTSFFNPIHFNTETKQALRKKLNFKDEDFIFIFTGRLVTDKGVNELITAFNKINENTKLKNFKSTFYKQSKNKNKYLIDLQQLALLQLIDAGISKENINTEVVDTKTNLSWNSYRRDGSTSGRNLSLIFRHPTS